MVMVREFRGRIVNRTIRVGEQIAILFQGAEKGMAGESVLVLLEEYLAERTFAHPDKEASKSASASVE